MPASGQFYARETRGVSDNFYKVYVTEGALCGAKLAGAVYDEASARMVTIHFGLLGFLMARWIGKRAVRGREQKEKQYDAMEPGSPTFMTADKANFSIGSSQIQGAKVFFPKGFLAKANPGIILELALLDGKKRTFSVIGEPSPQHVRDIIARTVPNVEVS